jgi:hypothetical protein
MRLGYEWRPVPGFLDRYEVSDLGVVRSIPSVSHVKSRWGGMRTVRRSGQILKPRALPSGYLRVSLSGRAEQYIHTLVLTAFVGIRPDGMQCAHLDGNPANNCLSNLAWKTPVENNADKELHGTVMRGRSNPMGRKTHCKRGHAFDDNNTRRSSGRRHCRACHRIHSAARREKCA